MPICIGTRVVWVAYAIIYIVIISTLLWMAEREVDGSDTCVRTISVIIIKYTRRVNNNANISRKKKLTLYLYEY